MIRVYHPLCLLPAQLGYVLHLSTAELGRLLSIRFSLAFLLSQFLFHFYVVSISLNVWGFLFGSNDLLLLHFQIFDQLHILVLPFY